MSTSVGAYATLAAVKTRLSITNTADDTILTTLCNQVNTWIEAKTGRVLTAIPTYVGGLAVASAAGDTTVTVGASGPAVNDVLLFGPISGTHESASVASVSGTSVTLATPLNAAYASNSAIERVYVYDGFDAVEGGHCLVVPRGIVSASSLEVATFSAPQGGAYATNVTWSTIPATDWFLRPTPQQRDPGWPATELWITNIPAPSDSTPLFYPGFNNVRLRGALGWPAMPDVIVGLAEKLVVGAYRARGAGGGQIVQIDVDGTRTIEQSMTSEDWRTINRYRLKDAAIW